MKKQFFLSLAMGLFLSAVTSQKIFSSEGIVSAKSRINWVTRVFTTDLSYDCKSADLQMPSGKKAASSKITLKMSQLIQPALLSLFEDSKHTLSDMVVMEQLTLDQVYEMWKPVRVKKIQQKDRSMHTAKKNFEVYEALVKGTDFGKKTFVKIRYMDFDDFYSDCEGKHITKSRANEIKTTLNLIWEYAKSIGLVDINYSKEFYLTDFKFTPKKIKPVKTPEERERLIEFYLSLDTLYGYVCALMECLNLRICEVKALKWEEVFLDDLIIYVTHMVDHEGYYREYTKNHDDEGAHCVPISPRALEILNIIKSKNYGFKDDFIFLGKNDNFILTYEVNKTIHKACKALGIKKNFTTHDCRRYAATNAALEGMTTPAMQMAFGWKDRETAEKYIQIAAATKEHQKMLVKVLN